MRPCSILAIALLGTTAALAGDLAPPAGPIAPTMKALDKVEPRTPISLAGTSITQSGAYYLTRDLTTPNGNAITINASRVTLDLNGFSLVGQPGASKGIVVLGSHSDVTVRNGTITDWPVRGIEASGNVRCTYVDLRFLNCGIDGLMAGDNAIISGCIAGGNGAEGLQAGADCVVTHCSAAGNTGYGFLLGGYNVITDCTATANGQDGIYSLVGSRISGCVADRNGGDGIFSAGQGQIVANNCHANGQSSTSAGINVSGGDNRVEGNNVGVNDFGLLVSGAGNLIIRNSASGNTSGNYSIAAGNTVGPVVNDATIAASTNPHANYSY